MVLPMALPATAAGEYAYEGDFSDSATAVEEMPEGWVRHPKFKNGTLYQKDGALYFDTKTASGVCAAFYEQSDYTDYMVEADFTMLDRTNDARWMGISYRMDADESAINNFIVTYNNITAIHGYYSAATTGYDGSVVGPGWNTYDGKYFVKETLSDTNHPEVVDAAKTTVNLKLVVVGNSITGFINGVQVLEAEVHNQTQATGSFGIATSNANIKVENFRVTDLTPEPEPEEPSQPSEPEESPYRYEATFSQSATEIEELPAGWKEHPNYKNATVTQKDGSMFLKAKDASGICAIYYDQDDYTDYRVEAEMTMIDKTNTARWLALAYRMDDAENAVNLFNLTWNNNCATSSYYYKETTGYDGSTVKSWSVADGKYFVKKTFSSSVLPELLNAGQTRVKLTVEVVGDHLTGYVNDVKVLESQMHNLTQEKGSFGIVTSQADVQIHSFKVTDLTQPEPEIREPYAYAPTFSTSPVEDMPEGWKRHPNYKAGTISQENGALYFKSKTGSGIGSAYYEQDMYHDYLVSADFTMEDKTDVNRWMGITYRMNGDENSTNMFILKYNNTAQFTAYYGVATDGYDGSTLARGWAPLDGVYFNQDTLKGYPELAGAGAGKVNLKVAIVDGTFMGFVNNVKVLETKIHNTHQALGSFGVSTSNADIKVENYRAIDLTELNNAAGASVAHGITLPASVNGKLLAAAEPGNYMASTTVSFGDTDAATAKILVAKSGDTELYANVKKDGTVTVTMGEKTLFTGTAAIANPANTVIQTVYANGAVKVAVDGTEVGYGFALTSLPGQYGYLLDGNTTVNAIALNRTTANITSVSFRSELTEVAYNTTPDWSKVSLTCQLSDGTQYQPIITSDMITGFDPATSGTQTLTLTYTHGGKTYTEKFNVTVKDDPDNIPYARVGIISDVHIGANASNITALQEALQYYKSKNVDAIVCVGDIGHDKMEYLDGFNEAVQAVFPNGTDDTVKIFVMGNHDTYAFNNAGYKAGTAEHNTAVEDYFANTFGVTADAGRAGLNYYKIINGYVFAGLYIQTPIEEREAFVQQVFSLPEAQGKPVFLVMHEIPVGSIYIAQYNPNSTSEMQMHEILKNYPNAVVLAGHSHNPLADERALWQGEYTAVSCGSLFGPSVEENMYEGGTVNGSFQPGNWGAKHALYMEIRKAGINIERYDFTNDAKLGKDWFIPVNDGVVDRTPYNYELRTQAAVAPEFAADAQATAQPLSESMIRITFPGSPTIYENMDDIVHSYIIRAYNDDTGELLATKRVLSQHYLGRVPEKESHTITYTGLNAQTNYRFEVTAAESYQKESAPLVVKADTKAFSTEGLTATFYANFDYPWDALEFDTYNHKDTDTMTFTEGVIRVPASNSSKAMIKGLTFANGTIETLISMNSTAANMNAGIYLFASDAADEQDTISAYNVHVDSSVGSRDLQVALYRFNGTYDGNLKSIVLTDYFADGNTKSPVKLKVEVSNGILSAFVDDVCVLTYSVGSRSGAVGLRSHYAGTDFDYIKVFETSAEYVAPDTAAFDTTVSQAKTLLASVEVEDTEGFTGKKPYVTQETYGALADLIAKYDIDVIRAYERHLIQAEPIIRAGMAAFETAIIPGKPAACVGQTNYLTAAEAILASNGAVVKLLAHCDEAIEITSNVTIDLAGYTMSNVTVSETAALTLLDTATDDYEGAYGTAAVTGKVARFANVDGKHYMVVEADGVYTAHRYYLSISHLSLQPAVVGFGYKAAFRGDEAVQTQIATIGYELWLDGQETVVSCATETFKNTLSLRLKNFQVEQFGETPVHARAVITLTDGTRLESTVRSYSMRSMVERIDASCGNFTTAQLQYTAMMIQDNAPMQAWNVANILEVLKPAVTVESIVVAEQDMLAVTGVPVKLTLEEAYAFTAADTLQTLPYSDYTDWIADYYFSMDRQAGEGLFLAGNYGDYGWTAIPVEAGKTYTAVPVVQLLLGKSLTYEEMVTLVGTFRCGVADTLGTNRDAVITVELRLTDPANPENTLVISKVEKTLVGINSASSFMENLMDPQTRIALNADTWTSVDDYTARISGYSYSLDGTKAYSDAELVFKATNNTGSIATGGVLLRCTTHGNHGVDGYLINVVSELHLIQVYYLENVYNTDGSPLVLTYLGGVDFGTNADVLNTEFYAKIEGDMLYVNTLERHKAGQPALVAADLTYGGVYEVYESGYFGILAWNDGVTYDLTLSRFTINGF